MTFLPSRYYPVSPGGAATWDAGGMGQRRMVLVYRGGIYTLHRDTPMSERQLHPVVSEHSSSALCVEHIQRGEQCKRRRHKRATRASRKLTAIS